VPDDPREIVGDEVVEGGLAMKDEDRTVFELIRVVFEVTEIMEVSVRVLVLVDLAEEVKLVVTVPS
jgi:hypothetical protein